MQGACCRGVLAMLPVLRRQSSSRDRDAEMPAMTFPICMTAIVGETAARHVRRFRIVCPTIGDFSLRRPVLTRHAQRVRSAVTACLIFTRVVALKGPIPTLSALKRDKVAP